MSDPTGLSVPVIPAALAGVAAPAGPIAPQAPAVDHHQHLFSPAVAALAGLDPIDADALIAQLDDAAIPRAVVLSVAYLFGSPKRTLADEYEQVMAANDWTSQQVARVPDRLRGLCGVNPLRAYALEEIARCAADHAIRHVRHGLKLHFGNSAVDYHDWSHITQLRRVFRAANTHGMAIVVHMRASISLGLPYGHDAARVFLDELLPEAPDVPVQIAHLTGSSGYSDDPPVDQAMSVFVEAIADDDPRVRRLLFDVATNVPEQASAEELALITRRIRELGVERVLYGSDAAVPGNPPRAGWAAFLTLPLRPAEFQAVAGNVAPYMR